MGGPVGTPRDMWGFPKISGTIFGGPNNKDCSILGSILGSPYLQKLPCRDCKYHGIMGFLLRIPWGVSHLDRF